MHDTTHRCWSIRRGNDRELTCKCDCLQWATETVHTWWMMDEMARNRIALIAQSLRKSDIFGTFCHFAYKTFTTCSRIAEECLSKGQLAMGSWEAGIYKTTTPFDTPPPFHKTCQYHDIVAKWLSEAYKICVKPRFVTHLWGTLDKNDKWWWLLHILVKHRRCKRNMETTYKRPSLWRLSTSDWNSHENSHLVVIFVFRYSKTSAVPCRQNREACIRWR